MARDYQSFLASRPKIRRNYNSLSPSEQSEWQNQYNAYGKKGIKGLTKQIKAARPVQGGGVGPVVDENINEQTGGLWGASPVINEQADMNYDTARWNTLNNRPAEQGPFGSTTWTVDAEGRPIRSTQMEGGLQGFYDEARNTGSLKYGDEAAKPWENTYNPNAEGGPAAPWAENYDTQRSRAEQAVIDKFNRQIEPQLAQEKEKLAQQLANEGNDRESPRYKRLMDELEQKQANLRLDAQAEALGQGRQEQAQGYGQGITSRQQYGTEAGQQFQQGLAGRQQYTGEQAQQWQSPYQALGNLGNFAAQYQGMYMPVAQERASDTDVSNPAAQWYNWTQYQPQNQQWQLAQIDRSGQWNLEAGKAAALAKATGTPP